MHPSSRAVNSDRELGPWTRVVETDLKTELESDALLSGHAFDALLFSTRRVIENLAESQFSPTHASAKRR